MYDASLAAGPQGAAMSWFRLHARPNGAMEGWVRRVFSLFVATTLLVVALCCGACGEDDRAAESLPASVLLLTIDTLRADHVGAYGYPEPISPNIDALAARGVVYERALAASSRTAPSHASILTGRHVRDHGIGSVNGATRIQDEPTLASLLATEGYDTAAFVSNTVLQRRTGLDKGFQLYDDALPEVEVNRGRVFERRAPATTANALAWLARAHSPWLLWVHYNDPHGPYDAPPPHDRHPSLSGVAVGPARGVSETPLPALDEQSGIGGIPAYQVLGDLRLPEQYRARYAAEIRFMDDSVGALLAAAERAAGEAGLLIVLTSDHGESHGEEGVFFAHGDGTAPNLAHVPFILVAPGLSPGRSRELVHHVDVVATLLELLGKEPPAGSVGLPLARYWRDGSSLPRRVVYTDVGGEVSAYRGERFERLRKDPYREESAVYTWTAEDGWDPAEADPTLHQQLARYAARSAPLRTATAPDAGEQDRLRALGYLPPRSKDDTSRAETALGVAAERQGDHAKAVAHYRAALRDNPRYPEAANNLAWLVATTEQPGLRDPRAAIELAGIALEQDPGSPAILDTLAAAYAAAERYPDAVRTQRQALEALSTSDASIQADFRARLEAYQERRRGGTVSSD